MTTPTGGETNGSSRSRDATTETPTPTESGNTTTVATPTPEAGLGVTFAYFPERPVAGEQIRFFLATTTLGSTQIANVQWDFDRDGRKDVSGREVGHTYETPGVYLVTLRVTTTDGREGEVSRRVRVATAPETTTTPTDQPSGTTVTPTSTADSSAVSIPGFGFLAGAAALAAVALKALRSGDPE